MSCIDIILTKTSFVPCIMKNVTMCFLKTNNIRKTKSSESCIYFINFRSFPQRINIPGYICQNLRRISPGITHYDLMRSVMRATTCIYLHRGRFSIRSIIRLLCRLVAVIILFRKQTDRLVRFFQLIWYIF